MARRSLNNEDVSALVRSVRSGRTFNEALRAARIELTPKAREIWSPHVLELARRADEEAAAGKSVPGDDQADPPPEFKPRKKGLTDGDRNALVREVRSGLSWDQAKRSAGAEIEDAVLEAWREEILRLAGAAGPVLPAKTAPAAVFKAPPPESSRLRSLRSKRAEVQAELEEALAQERKAAQLVFDSELDAKGAMIAELRSGATPETKSRIERARQLKRHSIAAQSDWRLRSEAAGAALAEIDGDIAKLVAAEERAAGTKLAAALERGVKERDGAIIGPLRDWLAHSYLRARMVYGSGGVSADWNLLIGRRLGEQLTPHKILEAAAELEASLLADAPPAADQAQDTRERARRAR